MTLTLTYKEAGFPAHYRQEQVRQVMDAVYQLRSIAITGRPAARIHELHTQDELEETIVMG